MKQKIEWYREVLELEPGSRVFFPLAKLLAADEQAGEAIAALRHGLLRHPDHVEARLLLVELLNLQHEDAELALEIDGLGKVFASYPGFWQAWSERLADNPALHDAALAMRFFSAALQGRHINWGSVIEYGLSAMLGPQSVASEIALDTPPPAQESVEHVSAPLPDLLAESSAPVDEAALDAFDEDDAEEDFSLRTRSMAEVLAEQGDVSGALEIYHELMQTAAEEEKASLEARAGELAQRLQPGHAESSAADDKVRTPGGESTRLVSLLESLAQRLEARAR
ncbi:tetratricopeptide repeat-containing protein [Desulfovibrio sp. OttesenSCG-928-F20]|nr:tetratricopeptide repeat-containing protein [Desulfovibrio sp. OttesenSCG-928-M16]MDL2290579.1 tetratricopeptide repeat-containing protein [Desulfovibrio sp. OttesenSCG-928-F20]